MSSLQLTGFEILEKRGEGGMATVWKARQVSLNRIVAVKILNTRLARDEADVQRFQAEAQAAARLKHPGIVQVYDARAEQGLYYFVMEYVEGYTCGEWLRRKGPLAERDVLLLADCVADALDYAWNKERIVHCDIKPDNIMIDADGTVKVADLGLARSISAMTAEEPSAEVFGTPAYISPEQSRGAADLDVRSDIYALGATMYHLLTGHALFEGYPEEQVMDLQITSSVPDPFDEYPRLSKGVCWLLEKMLAKDPAHRPQNWAGVRADIARVKRRLLPYVKGLPENASTIRRSARRAKVDRRALRVADSFEPSPGRIALRLAGLAILAALAVWIFVRMDLGPNWRQILSGQPPRAAAPPAPAHPPQAQPGKNAAPPPPPVAPGQGIAPDDRGAVLFDAARRWFEEHPEQFDQARLMFEQVAEEAPGTTYATLARNEARRVTERKEAAIAEVMERLKAQASVLVENHEFARAAAIYEDYRGRYAGVTQPLRRRAARELRAQQEELEQKEVRTQWEREKEFREILNSAAAEFLAGQTAEAAQTLTKAMQRPEFAERRSALERLKAQFSEAAQQETTVAESFRAQQGQEIVVPLLSGPLKLQIVEVRGRTVAGLESRTVGTAVATRRVSFNFDELTLAERLNRMGPDDRPAAALAKGKLALDARAWSLARKHFEACDPLLAPVLTAKVDALHGAGARHEAETAP